MEEVTDGRDEQLLADLNVVQGEEPATEGRQPHTNEVSVENQGPEFFSRDNIITSAEDGEVRQIDAVANNSGAGQGEDALNHPGALVTENSASPGEEQSEEDRQQNDEDGKVDTEKENDGIEEEQRSPVNRNDQYTLLAARGRPRRSRRNQGVPMLAVRSSVRNQKKGDGESEASHQQVSDGS